MLAPVDDGPARLDHQGNGVIEPGPVCDRDPEVLAAALMTDSRQLVVGDGEVEGEIVATVRRPQEQDVPVTERNAHPKDVSRRTPPIGCARPRAGARA